MPNRRNQINVHGRIDELELDAKSVLRSYVKQFGTVSPNEVKIYVTTNDHFQTYEVVGIHVEGLTVVHEVEGEPLNFIYFLWDSLIPYSIFTVVKQLHQADMIKLLGDS